MRALGQGYGKTEDGTNGILLETNVTVITIDECREILRHNSSRKIVWKPLSKGIPFGLNDQFLCTQGEQKEEVSKSRYEEYFN